MSQRANQQPSSGISEPSASNREESRKIPVIEEQLEIDKKIVETGAVQVTKKVHAEQVQVDLSLTYDVTDIRRIEVNRIVDTAPPAIRQEGDTTIIPVLREVLVKKLLLVEEIHITKLQQQEPAREEATLRRETVQVERREPPE